MHHISDPRGADSGAADTASSPASSGSESSAPTPRSARTHGKTILLGEHAVLYGAPAIALPVAELGVVATVTPLALGAESRIDSRVYSGPLADAPERLEPVLAALRGTLAARSALTAPEPPPLHLRIDSDIPVARGLGSSAAVAGAVVDAVAAVFGATLDPETRFALVQASERIAHGTASGLDARTTISTAPIWFDHGVGRPTSVGAELAFVIADTGVASGTREAVGAVRERHAVDPAAVEGPVGRIAALTGAGRGLLASGDAIGLGATLDAVQSELQQLDVSSAELDRLIDRARATGALGAKLTGGGRGGCLLALAADAAHATELAATLRTAGAASTWTVRLPATSVEGVAPNTSGDDAAGGTAPAAAPTTMPDPEDER
ncbi:mevalonate kinase [Schumannella soli]|uniref:mevalonate kinase n=1 Tax=Schumannella soli TaxID=2590779 RepID=A0A506XWT6_9MICO|nr:mevalonate kinase [Schumannella soli]TPW74093.1 mevalonate kinase [Schumannella soli]